MFELIKINEKCYYIESPVKVGVVKLNDTDVVMIDGGSDKDAGKRILRVLNGEGWNLKAIYNTHSHADHSGGNHYLQENTGCKVYSYGVERHFVQDPILEPGILYGGFPFKELQHKFLMAQKSDCLEMTDDVLPEGMEILHLEGHAMDMVGFKVGNVAYIGDAVSSREVLDKYGIQYTWNVGDYLESLEKLKDIDAEVFVPAHVAPMNKIELMELAGYNRKVTLEIIEKVQELLAEPKTFEELLKEVFDSYEMAMNVRQYALIGSTLKAYITYLKEAGKITYMFEDNRMLWKTVQD